ncbi:transporter [Actinomyces trachealis]|uniref:transporter n=1 Tax=Actinomyces trachealis TaxID=2763540 RepID=UPI0018C6B833|nr:transporter [Actinomyces trachealis]
MATTLIKLRWRLTANALRNNIWAVIGTTLGAVYGFGFLVALVSGAVSLGAKAPQHMGMVLTLLGAVTVLGWCLVPMLFTGVDSTLDPRAMAAWIAPSQKLSIGLVAASATGIPGVVTGAAFVLPALTWAVAGHPASALLAVVLAPVALATCVLASRVLVIGSGVSTSRRGRDLMALLGVLVLLVASQLPFFLNLWLDSRTLGLGHLGNAARILGWTPLGWAFFAPAKLAAGHVLSAVLLTLGAVALPVLLLLVWERVLTQVMTGRSARSGSRSRITFGQAAPTPQTASAQATRTDAVGAAEPLLWHRRLAQIVPSPAAAVAARCLRYWRSDPRYLAQGAALLLVPPLLVGVALANTLRVRASAELGEGAITFNLALGHAPNLLLGLAPAVALIGGWALHNDLGFDSTAQWMHLSAGLSGRHDRLGRVVGLMVWLLPILVLLLGVLSVWTGRWDMAPAVLGVTLAVLGCALAWSSITSVLLPYETNAPGESPMHSRTSGMALVVSLVQLAGVGLISLAACPTAIGFVAIAAYGAWAWGWLLLLAGALWGLAALWLGVRVGGALLEQRWVRVLTTVRGWPGHAESR